MIVSDARFHSFVNTEFHRVEKKKKRNVGIYGL